MTRGLTTSVLALLTVTSFLSPIFGQDSAAETVPVDSPTIPSPEPEVVIQPTQELAPFNRVIYVLDVSGSMRDVLPVAIRTVDVFMTDDFQAAVVTFNATHERWPGVTEPCGHAVGERCTDRCLPAGWCRLPLHFPELMTHLSSFVGAGDTRPASAIDYALRNAPAECLIVFISDGGFPGDPVIEAAWAGIEWRAEQGLAPVQILVWSTVEEADKQLPLVALARIGGGGLWRARPPEVQEPPPEEPEEPR